MLYISQNDASDVFIQKQGEPADLSQDVFMHYALHKEKMMLLGINRANSEQPTLGPTESLDLYADAAAL